MPKAMIHAKSSARRWGGKPEDYFAIHELMDLTKGAIADNRHRVVTHNAWFIVNVLPRIFGETFVNSDGKTIQTKDIGEQHCLEDFRGKIPSLQDYAVSMKLEPWMSGLGFPPSCEGHDKSAYGQKVVRD